MNNLLLTPRTSDTDAVPSTHDGGLNRLDAGGMIAGEHMVELTPPTFQMSFRNALEPAALLQHLASHPPTQFTLGQTVAGTPTFVAPFDLLTTADTEFAARVRAWPGFRWWRGLLRPRTCFVGSTASEYAWLPMDVDPGTLARALTTAHARECRFLIVKDLPQASPLLGAADNSWNEAFARALVGAGFILLEGQALAFVPIDFADTDAYLARLSRGARRNIRRKLRVRNDLEIESIATGDPRLAQRQLLDEIYALYENVYAQSELHFDYLSRAFFDAVLADGACGGLLFTYRRQGKLIGWNLCFVHAGMLIDKYIGLRYPEARTWNLYAISWMYNLEYARQHQLRFYVAGWTDPEVKAHLGASMTFTRHAVRPRSALLRVVLRRLARHFESDSQWFEERRNASGRT